MTDKKTEDESTGTSSRSQNVVRVLPRDWSSLAEVITPSMERVDSTVAATQFLVITPDPASTFAVVRGAFERFGTVGIDLFPATAEHRAARMMAGVPVPAVAGPPVVLRALVSRSVLRLDGVKAVLFAWIEDVIEAGGDQLAALEAILAELPEGAARTLVVREVTPAVQSFIDRYMFRARRAVAAADAEETPPMAMEYVTTPSAARPASLWRLLDELDPPSAVIVARHPESESDARRTLSQLGYRRADDAVRVSSMPAGENVHTIIFYDPPLAAADIEAARAVTAARVIAFVEARDVGGLKQLSGGMARPLAVGDAVRQARRKEDTLRAELKQVLDDGVAFREMTSLEPLLEQYDAVEIAAALLRLLERERDRALAVPVAPKPPRPGPGVPPERAAPRPGSPRPDRRPSAPDGGGPPRNGDDRPPRSRDDRPPRGRDERPPRGRDDRPPRGRDDRPPRGGPPGDSGRYGSRDSGRGGPPRGGPPRGRGGDRGGSRR